jgi:hypothetical protein
MNDQRPRADVRPDQYQDYMEQGRVGTIMYPLTAFAVRMARSASAHLFQPLRDLVRAFEQHRQQTFAQIANFDAGRGRTHANGGDDVILVG